MKQLASPILISLLLGAACGDSGGASTGSGTTTEASATGGATGATEPTTSGSTTTGTTGGSAGETTGATTTTNGTSGGTSAVSETGTTTTTSTDTSANSTSSGTSNGTSSGGPGGDPLTISLKDINIYANCQPIIDPDNILGWWTVVYDNVQGAVESSAELTGAVLTLSLDNNPSMHDITVLPTQSGPVAAGTSVEQEQMKQKGPPTPGCAHCDEPYRLKLTFSSGGVDVPVVHEDTLPCVY